jgi:hypothetical protein
MIFGIAVILAACCTTPSGAEVAKHTQLFTQYAQEGRKDEAEEEEKKLAKAFEESLEADSRDSAEFLNANCATLLQSNIDQLKKSNENVNVFVSTLRTTGRLSNNLCPLAQEQRRIDVATLLIRTALLYKKCGDDNLRNQLRQSINNPAELGGLSAVFCKGDVAYLMPMRNPPPVAQPKPSVPYPVPPNLFPTPALPLPAPSAQ